MFQTVSVAQDLSGPIWSKFLSTETLAFHTQKQIAFNEDIVNYTQMQERYSRRHYKQKTEEMLILPFGQHPKTERS